MSTQYSTNHSVPAQVAQAPRATTRRAGTAGYWIGALVAVVTTVGAVVWGAVTFLGWRAAVDDFPRVSPPGTAVVSVTDTGTQFLYLEHDRGTPVPAVPEMSVTDPSGAAVTLTDYRGELRYDVPGVSGRVGDAVQTFSADVPGTYRVTVADAAQGTVVAVGEDLFWSWGPAVVGVVALLLGGLLVALVVVLVTLVRRSGSRA